MWWYYIYRGRRGLIKVAHVTAYVGVPSTMATGGIKRRYYRTKYRNGAVSALVDVTNTCL